MWSFASFAAFFILTILICAPSDISADCPSCCHDNTGCNTAYNGRPGQCCGSGFLRFCCPTSTSCGSYPYCIQDRYWGHFTLGQLIGLIAGIIFVIVLLLSICGILCRRYQKRGATASARVITLPSTPANNYGTCPPPPPYNQNTTK
ncbi:unnamed protein product [Adineta ricciae]|uniref:Uncharacterized protein n=1 Tax=Adineta ricciae TaxID=249248 RepID=A0A813UMS7_ADIRI|nr:unnamed protein product [Adineta ricciae]CAF1438924.1 unnamed protein product [Adineta ricciae]